jgi:hypothetical protein
MFTKSTDWFDDAKGWKSTQGGFSAIKKVTTDQNNMGGFFVRKLAGGAGCAVHLHKILPLISHENGAQWAGGHFRPVLMTAVVGNIAIAAFYATYLEDLTGAGAQHIPLAMLAVLAIETVAILYYLFINRQTKRLPAMAMPEGKTPDSLISNIVSRTTLIVTSLVALVAVRDLFFPGTIIELIPRDDIYLEWTNAFLHSPPEGSPESADQGLEAPLYIGDKFVSQLAAVNILVLSLYKYVTAAVIRFGADGSGTAKSRMIWKASFLGDSAILLCFRFFSHAARTASFDMRWHLVFIAYEAFIFGRSLLTGRFSTSTGEKSHASTFSYQFCFSFQVCMLSSSQRWNAFVSEGLFVNDWLTLLN